jgi:hypothetical protein
MPETTENYHRIPNPNYAGAEFTDQVRTGIISQEKGVKALYAPLKKTGQWKVRTFLFDREKWSSLQECEAWARDNRDSFKQFGPGLRHVQTFEAGFSKRASATPTEDELTLINNYALEPLTAEDVYVREMRLTNDQWGKHHVRLSRGFQRSVIETLPGKSLLLGHPEVRNLPAEPIGVFFDAYEKRDPTTGVSWGMGKFYLAKSAGNEHARTQIDAGVWRYASVGMELDWGECSICGQNMMSGDCKHIPGRRYPIDAVSEAELAPEVCEDDPNSVYCGVIFRGQGKAMEGSIVYLPELNGTQIVAEALAEAAGDFGRAKELLLESDGAAPEVLTDRQPEAPGVAQTAEKETDEPKGGEPNMADDPKVAELEAKLSDGEGRLAALQADHEAATAKAKALEAAHEDDKAFRLAAVADLERLAGLLKRTAEMDAYKSAAGEDLAAMPAAKIMALQAEWAQAVTDALPAGRQSSDAAPPEKPDEDAVCVSHARII